MESADGWENPVILMVLKEREGQILHNVLEMEGFQVINPVANGQVLQVCAQSSPDIIFLDANMSGSFEVCLRLKKNKEFCGTPVLMLVDPGNEEAVQRAVEAGVDDFITRPVHKTILLRRLKHILYKGATNGILRHQNSFAASDRRLFKSLRENGGVWLQALFEAFDGYIYICSQDYRVEIMNKRFARHLGRDVTGELCYKAIHTLDSPCSWCVIKRVLRGETVRSDVKDPKTNSWYHVVNMPINYENGRVSNLTLIVDITERKRAEEELRKSEERFRSYFELPLIGIAVLSSEMTWLEANDKMCSMLGYSREELLKISWADLTPEDDLEMDKETHRHVANGDFNDNAFEKRFIRRDGTVIDVEVSAVSVKKEDGTPDHFVALVQDVTERKQAQEKLRYLSLHDNLTGLYNRTYFEEEMRRLSVVRHAPVGIIICDVDGLKLVNDSVGHDAGDMLLKRAAEVLKKCFRNGDMIARVGGDEFAVLLPNSPLSVVEDICRRIREAITRYNESVGEIPLNMSIGFAVSDDPSVSTPDIFKEADNNMCREKLLRSQSTRSAIVQALMKTLEARDLITEGHAERLQNIVVSVASNMGMPEQSLTVLRLLAQFHDIGKVGISDKILFKPGPLTPEERAEMQRHCEIGYRIALTATDLRGIADLVYKHHEWWNGRGYPEGLSGEEIPLECRMLAIADAYDAMTSDRPYRKALPRENALEELRRCAGAQFDPRLVEMFERFFRKAQDIGSA